MADTPTISVEVFLGPEKRAEIDAIARWTERDRKAVLAEALDNYLELHRWKAARIQEGLRQADAGEFATDEELARIFGRGHAE